VLGCGSRMWLMIWPGQIPDQGVLDSTRRVVYVPLLRIAEPTLAVEVPAFRLTARVGSRLVSVSL
jgi:hypothetical protein